MSLTSVQLVCVLVFAVTLSGGQNLERETCDASRREVDIEMTNANAIIGGLFEIRNPIMGGYACGQPHKELIQVYEATRWALKKVNDIDYVPGIKLGMKAYETCFSKSVAVNAVHKFYPQLSSTSSSCTDGSTISLGMLGPMSSWTAKPVASLTKTIPASVLSPRSMSIDLSDKNEYPYFLRTVPTSNSQARAMLAALEKLSWRKVIVVYSDSVYGRDGYDTLMHEAYKKGICIVNAIPIPSSGSVTDIRDSVAKIVNYDVNAAIFLGSYANAVKLFSAMEGIANGGQLQWMLSDLNLMESYMSLIARGAIVVVPRTITVTEFRDYFLNLDENTPPAENPWFVDWYMTTYNCRLPGVTYAPYASLNLCGSLNLAEKLAAYKQVPYVETAIKAVYAYASALRVAQSGRCAGVSSFCSALQTLTTEEFFNYLRNVNFQFSAVEGIPSMVGATVDFDSNGDSTMQDFTVFNYNNKNSAGYTFVEVGSYINGVMTLNVADIELYDAPRTRPLTSIFATSCPAPGCMYCDIPRDAVEFLYTPGDVVIAALVNGHYAGKEPFSCGATSGLGMAETVAYHYALNTVKTALPGVLSGVSLGGLVADICSNAFVGKLFMNNLQDGRHIVHDSRGNMVDPFTIKAVVEAQNCKQSEEFSMGFSLHGIPEISTSASCVAFGDKKKFPRFTRSLPGNDKMAVAIFNVLANMGWQYIQTIQSEDYGADSVAMLREYGTLARVCVSASHTVGKDGSYSQIIASLQKKPSAAVVVLFAHQADIRGLLEAARAAGLTGKYMFIGTDSWGSRRSSVKGLEDIAHGSLIIEPQATPITNFRTWLNTLDPRTSNKVPGFKEWYQVMYNCYIDADAMGDYPVECGSGSITNAPMYEDPFSVSYMIDSVYAVAKALDAVLKQYCGASYTGVCVQFRADPAAMSMLNEYIRDSSFTGDSGALFQIKDGEGTNGYNILNYRQNSGYANVGTYDVSAGRLTLSKSQIQYPTGAGSNFASSCPGNCMECSYVGASSSMVTVPGDVQIGGAFAIHVTASDDKFSCGELRSTNGIQFVTSVMYALDQINSKKAPVHLNGVSLGAMLFDHCNVQGRSLDILTNLYAGLLSESPSNPHSKMLSGRNLKAWITDNTASVFYMKDAAKSLNLPLISPFASSEPLSDREMFPTFFRTVEGDITLSVAMAKLVKSLNFKFLTVVYSDDDYGRSGKSTFETVASQEGLCILQSFMISDALTATDVVQNIAISTSQVVIMWTNGGDSVSMLQSRKANIAAVNVLYVLPMPMMELAERIGAGGKTFMLNIKTGDVSGYRDYMATLATAEAFHQNPFLAEYYMSLFDCDLPGVSTYQTSCPLPLVALTDSSIFKQDNYVVPTINAVYAFTAGLDALLQEKCGSDYDELCTAFLTMDNTNDAIMEKMEGISFLDPIGRTFMFLDREGNTGLNLFFYNGVETKLVGDIAGASLQVTDLTLKGQLSTTASACFSNPCTICLNNINAFNFTYKQGDILLGGIFDVHDRDLTPFSCGDLKTLHGFQLLEAFNYAIDKVNDKSGVFGNILKNVKLGGVALDSCESAIRTGYLVSNIHNGLTKLTRNSQTVDPEDINMYIGAYSSDSSIYLARILKELKIPQISYASSSTQLLDTVRYPYFMRTVPTDDKQVEGIIKFLDKYNLRYVQVVFKRDNYGELATQAFTNMAAQYKICVAHTLAFPDNGSVTRESANEVVTGLLEQPNANTIIVFASTDYIAGLVQGIRRNPHSHGRFHFVGSETWGNNMEAIKGNEELVQGAVTLTLESSDISDFDIYLGSKSPGNYPENPWFPEFYEEMVNCYLTIPNGKHTRQCTSISENIVAQRDYIQDPGILHVINSVYAAAYLIDLTLKETCGSDYTTVCGKYQNNQNRHELLMNHINDVAFNDPTNTPFEFTDRREGNKGYQIYSLNKKMMAFDEGFSYDKIGTYSFSGDLSIDTSYMPSWDGSCARQDSCTECPSVRDTRTRDMYQPSTNPDAATILLVTNIHRQGSDPYRCGSFRMNNMNLALAFFFTLENLTPHPFDVRGLVVDYCENTLRIDQDLYGLLSTGKFCSTAIAASGTVSKATIAGVVTASSSSSMAVNRVVKPLGIPIVSGGATSVLLSDQLKFPYFSRTVPPDDQQMSVIAKILAANDWSYVSALYSRESYGISAIDQLKKSTRASGVCIGKTLSMASPPVLDDIKSVLQELADTPGANVIVLCTNDPRDVLEAADALGLLDRFIWIGTDTWGTLQSVVAGFEEKLLGAITVDLRSAVVQNFVDYVKSITYTTRRNIPADWFEEFYQEMHQCRLSDAATPDSRYTSLCTKGEVITDDKVHSSFAYILHVIAATYSLVNGIKGVKDGPCSNMAKFEDCVADNTRWDTLLTKILETDWDMNNTLDLQPPGTFNLRFTDQRFVDVGYTIYSFIKDGADYKYQEVGSMAGNKLTFSRYDHQRGSGFTSRCPPNIVCDCDVAVALPLALMANESDRYMEPRNYFFYNERTNDAGQTVFDQIYMWPIWAVAVGVLTCVGLLVAVLLFLYFLVAYPVRGGTTVLGFMLLLGVIGIYAINFAFFLPASDATCGARRFVMGVVYAIVFAALLVKALDNWRYSDMEYSMRKYKGLTSACSLFLFALGIVAIEAIIPIMWLILVRPTASLYTPEMPLDDWSWCDPHDEYDHALVMSMIFVMFLVIVTGIVAALAWDSDSNYYESRWIFVSSMCTAGCFLVWMIVSTNAGPPFRDPAVALGNFANATALLICIPIRKLFLLCYLKNHEEPDKAEHLGDERVDMYSTVYSNQGYEGDMFQPVESKHSSDMGFDNHNL